MKAYPALAALYLMVAALPAAHPGMARATDASTCYTIPDADARTFCLAKAHHDPGMCYAIQNTALRSECLAEVRTH